MKKSDVNFIIDALMFVFMALLIGIGLLIKYVLLSGREAWEKYQQNVELKFLNLDRHEWGEIHLIIGLILTGLLVLHIILHWKLILCVFKRMLAKKNTRSIAAIVFVIVSAFCISFPFLVSIEKSEHEVQYRNSHSKTHIKDATSVDTITNFSGEKKQNEYQTEHEAEHKNRDVDIRGFMTLNEVAEKYNIPVSEFKSELKIPDNESNDIKLGQLIRKYSFEMSDVKDFIRNNNE